MNDVTDIAWNGEGRIEVITFEMRCEMFAIEAAVVREIVDPLVETVVPGSSPLVGSVVNFRGHIIPLADLHGAFGMPPVQQTADSRIVIIEYSDEGETGLIGIKADKVHEVTALERETAEAVPRIGVSWRREFVRGLVKRNGAIVIVPNLQAIFSAYQHMQSAPAEAVPAMN
jgi:purine-binding chemotaxis protein CheW